jgi:ribosomal protein S18 acetylase RimI-like enzyme
MENAGAIAFYEAQGYERSHIVKSFYGLGRHAYVYRKALGNAAQHGVGWNVFLKA